MSDTTTETTFDMSSLASSVTHCAACGSDPEKASRMQDLEAEVHRLQQQATAAGKSKTKTAIFIEMTIQMLTEAYPADKLASYEEEIRHLKATRSDSPVDELTLQVPDADSRPRPQSAQPQSSQTTQLRPLPARSVSSTSGGRFSFLSSSRKQQQQQQQQAQQLSATTANPAVDIASLSAALARETMLRERAEKKVTDTENEIEDLSATLFESTLR